MSAHTTQTELKLIGKLILEGEMACESGLHVGAGKGSLEIGGADNPVVKDAFGLPYIPGSSLRGRIRSLLENALGLTAPAELVYLSKRKGPRSIPKYPGKTRGGDRQVQTQQWCTNRCPDERPGQFDDRQ